MKERFGLADYRVHSLEAILCWHTLIFAAYAFVQYRRMVPLMIPQGAAPTGRQGSPRASARARAANSALYCGVGTAGT